jgi:peptidoglycan biosynthesis protein MviN/MurJ (putative lipid II flippase)
MFLGVFSVAVTQTVYQYGAFESAQTEAVAATLAMFSIGLVFNGASLLVIRALFSLQRPWLPTVVSLLTLAVNIGANFIFYDWLGLAGIALSTSIVNIVGFLALYLSLRRTVGLLHGRASARTAVLAAVLSVLAVAIAWGASLVVVDLLGDGQVATIMSLLTAVLVISVVYGFGIVRLRLVSPTLAARIPILRSINK